MNLKTRNKGIVLLLVLLMVSLGVYRMTTLAANGRFTLRLVAQDTKKGISGAEFVLQKADDDSVKYPLQTDSNGDTPILSSVPEGNYILIQNSTGAGYRTHSKVNLTIVPNQLNSHYLENVRQGTVVSGTVLPLGGTTLRLQVVDGKDGSKPIPNAVFLVKGNGVRNEITTDANGFATLPGLHAGDYVMNQIAAPEGYLEYPTEIPFQIPDPKPNQYPEFVDVKADNYPYDASKWGVLNVNVVEGRNNQEVLPTNRIGNVKIRITDDLGNSQVGITDANGNVKFRNLSQGRTYKARIIETPYEYEGNGFTFSEDITLTIGNTKEIKMFVPRRQMGLVTINNYETGDFSQKIHGSRFKLTHPDGTSRIVFVENGVLTLNLPLHDELYKLEQLNSDGTHNINPKPFLFQVSKPIELNVNNDLKDPTTARTTFQFEKVWGDKPATNLTTKVRLFADGREVSGKEITIQSKEGTVTRTFSNLPKYDENHQSITYTVKEDKIPDWYAEYEEVEKNSWRITNLEGEAAGVCFISPNKGILFYSTDNVAYMTENGDVLKKILTFDGADQFVQLAPPSGGGKDKRGYGHGIAYDRNHNILYGINGLGYLAVNNIAKGENGTVTNVVRLKEVAEEAEKTSVDGKIVGNDFRKVNTLETSVDGKYLIAKALQGTNIYLYRISDVLAAPPGTEVTAAKVIPSKHNAQYVAVADGDVIQYPNGDILYTGHEKQWFSNAGAPRRSNYNFYLHKYEGPRDASGKPIDVANGTYSAPINVGGFAAPSIANYYNDSSKESENAVEGLAFAFNKIFFTSTIETGGLTTPRKIIEWNMGIIDNPPNRNTPEGTAIPFRLHSLKNTGESGKIRSQSEINTYFGGAQNLVTRIPELNSSFADMTGADRENCSPSIKVRGKKSWVGDTPEHRPQSVEVQLYADGVEVPGAKRTLNAENNWSYEFTNLTKNNANGQRIQYTVKEKNIPTGYLEVSQDYSIVNTLLKGEFSIQKTNEDKSEFLEGAVFSLWNEERNQLIATKETGEDGHLTFEGLTGGTYFLVEDKSPSGYIAQTKVYKVVGRVNQATKKVEFTLYENDVEVEKTEQTSIIRNTIPSFQIKLFKVDAETNEKINLVSRFEFLDSQKQKLQDAILQNGELLLNGRFPAGRYYLREIAAPQDYLPLGEDIELTLDETGRIYLGEGQQHFVGSYGVHITGSDTIELRIRNQKENGKGRFIINKTDDSVPAQKLSGARFRLSPTDENGVVKQKEPTFEKVSDNRGIVLYENLEPGFYRLEEVEAPAFHTKTKKVWKVEVKTNGTTILTEIAPQAGVARSAGVESFYSAFRMATGIPVIQNGTPNPIQEHGLSLKQSIFETGTQGKYRVDVEVTDEREEAEIVILVEDTDSSNTDATKRYKYRDDDATIAYVKHQLLQNIDIPNAKITIIGVNSTATTYVERQDKAGALSSFTQMNGGNESNRSGLKAGFEKANQILTDSNAKNKTVVALLGRSLYSPDDSKEGIDFVGIRGIIDRMQGELRATVLASSEVNYFDRRDPFRPLLSELGIETGTYPDGRSKGNTMVWKEHTASHLAIQQRRYNTIFSAANDTEVNTAYHTRLPNFARIINDNYGKAKTLSPNLVLNSNVVFERLENANGMTYNNGTIGGTVAIPQDKRVTFSYYVHSNPDHTTYNVLEPINRTATVTENIYGHRGNLPIPKVNLPGVTIHVTKAWDSEILPEDRVAVEVVLKKGNEEIERKTLRLENPSGTYQVVPKFDATGTDILYRIEERGQDGGILVSRITPETVHGGRNLEHSVNIQTSYTKVNLRVKKDWVSTEEKDRLPVTVELVAKAGERVLNLAELGIQGKVRTVLNGDNQWTDVFDQLPRVYQGEKVSYSVKETKVGDGENRLFYYEVHYVNGEEFVVVTNKKIPEITVVNEKSIQKPMEFYLNKTSNLGGENQIKSGNLTIRLTNARIFEKDGQKVDIKTFDLRSDYEAGKGLKVEVPVSLSTGTYILTEEEAPIGYEKTTTRYHISIDQERRRIDLIRTDTGEGSPFLVASQNLYREEPRNTGEVLSIFSSLEIVNRRREYPKTGGRGSFVSLFGGMIVMLGAGIGLRKKE